jgi:hypothetical protein
VTYNGEHNHEKPTDNLNSVIGTSWNNSSQTRLPVVGVAGSFPDVGNFHSPDTAMQQFDQPESLYDDYDILIEKMKTVLEDFLLDFNHLIALFP